MPRTRRIRYWLLMGVLLCVLSAFLDNGTIAWVHAHSVPSLRHLAKFLTRWGDFFPIVTYLALLFLGARLLRREDWARTVTLMFGSAVAAGAVANVLRAVTGRARPCAHVAPGWYGLRLSGLWTASQYQFSSFPSAHTAVAFGAAVPLVYFASRRWAALGLAIACAIGASRIYSDAHHLSDVMAGAFVGASMSTAVCFNTPWLVLAGRRVQSFFPLRLPRPAAPEASEGAFS